MKLAGVCIITADVLRLTSFYELLFSVNGEGDETHMGFPCIGLAIFSESGMEEMAPGSMLGTGSGKVSLSFDVLDADLEFERVLALGAEIIMMPKTHPWGLRSFWCKDPDGNILSLRSPAETLDF